MKAILFKSISPGRPWEVARRVQEDVDRWAERENLRPVKCLSAWVVGIPLKPIDFTEIEARRWKAAFSACGCRRSPRPGASTVSAAAASGSTRRGGYDDPVAPVAWEQALKTGMYVLDDHGRLLPAIRDTVQLCADHGVALSFGHLSPQEMDALAEETGAIGYRRAFIDHPFSEVFELDVPKMKRWADAGVRFAPHLGRALAAARVWTRRTWWRRSAPSGPSTSCCRATRGSPLLPQTVEAYRLLAAMLRAYGMTEVEMRQLMTGSAKELPDPLLKRQAVAARRASSA